MHCGVRLHGKNACYVILLPNTGYTYACYLSLYFANFSTTADI